MSPYQEEYGSQCRTNEEDLVLNLEQQISGKKLRFVKWVEQRNWVGER